MKKFLQLDFIPRSTDFGLLVLRLWFGLTLFFNHGLGKLLHYSQMSSVFPDPLHLGSQLSLILAIVAEVLAAGFLVLGVATRLCALIIFLELLTAFMRIHQHSIAMGPHSGELAFAYMGAALAVLFTGGGRYVLCKQTNVIEAPVGSPVAPPA